MLDVLAGDPDAVKTSRATVEPILEYDRETSRNLLETLETYLRENGNTSAAARALYFNRHSLMYRLRKIEALTGRSLERYEDRFMLDLSVKVLRLVERREQSLSQA
ncbi:MAG: helix-turn-helix domain-containing protein [Solirubrobacteraceae bacterium]